MTTSMAKPSPESQSTVLEVVRHLPPEAIVKVVDIIGEVVATRASLALKHADFVQEMTRLRETSAGRERVLGMLSMLLLDAEVNDEAKLRLVDTICALALR